MQERVPPSFPYNEIDLYIEYWSCENAGRATVCVKTAKKTGSARTLQKRSCANSQRKSCCYSGNQQVNCHEELRKRAPSVLTHRFSPLTPFISLSLFNFPFALSFRSFLFLLLFLFFGGLKVWELRAKHVLYIGTAAGTPELKYTRRTVTASVIV